MKLIAICLTVCVAAILWNECDGVAVSMTDEYKYGIGYGSKPGPLYVLDGSKIRNESLYTVLTVPGLGLSICLVPVINKKDPKVYSNTDVTTDVSIKKGYYGGYTDPSKKYPYKPYNTYKEEYKVGSIKE